MKRSVLIASLIFAGFGATWVAAQTPAPQGREAPQQRPRTEARPPARGMGGGPMMGGGMGMGGGGMMCPMMLGADTRIEVRNLPKGVSITLTNDNPDAVTRLQKMAEATRLMHEATAQ